MLIFIIGAVVFTLLFYGNDFNFALTQFPVNE